jgi:putative toxin-antitoxin system antitoxin component (TIGR02293 family)
MSTTFKKLKPKKTSRATARYGSGIVAKKITGAGVVKHYIQGSMKSITNVDFNPGHLIEVIEAGLPVTELTDLHTSLDVPSETLARMLGISKATFHRSKGPGRTLNPAVSDRVVRFARLLGKAVKVFGDMDDAKRWLNSPQFGLGGAVPLDYAKTEVGAREVENLLGRIEYGVYA